MKCWASGYVCIYIPILYPTWGYVCLKITRGKKILLLAESGLDDIKAKKKKKSRMLNCQIKLNIN